MATSTGTDLGSRALAVRAASRALDAAGRTAAEIEILVNAGIYRDENIIEPAMGPFVQRGLGANASFPPEAAAGTFSFDLANGACGLLSGISVVDGFMRSGRVRRALVVASDTDPSTSTSVGYDFAPAGGAILLRAGSDGEGFAWFHSRTWSEHFDLYEGRLVGTDDLPAPTEPKGPVQHVRLARSGDFLERAAECAGRTIADAVERGLLDPAGVDLVVPAPVAPGFADALRRCSRLEAPVATADGPAAVHTASTAFALEAALGDGSWARSRRVLFVAAGAGVTVTLGLYER